MGLNTIDGLLALEQGQKSRIGGFLNEAGDIISDFAMVIPSISFIFFTFLGSPCNHLRNYLNLPEWPVYGLEETEIMMAHLGKVIAQLLLGSLLPLWHYWAFTHVGCPVSPGIYCPASYNDIEQASLHCLDCKY